MARNVHKLKIKSIGIDTYRENIIFMKEDCPICMSEGFTALTRVVVQYKDSQIVATLNVVYSDLLSHDEAGLSKEAMIRLNVRDGDEVEILPLRPIESFSRVRAKMYGTELSNSDFTEIITDVVSGHYSNIELASFITVCSGNNLSVQEIISLTKAMISSGEKIKWDSEMIFDKHSVGGLPGNRTTPIVVSITAAAGLTIPKTSSRAITSPAGTADTIETFTNPALSIGMLKQVVKKTGGCLAWGGGVNLSPADDILISVERSLSIDSAGQMVASVLSKKAAAGSTHILIDIPLGKTAKVRSGEEALKLQYYFKAVAESIGINVETLITDGSQPVGRGIGPCLEAFDVLSILRNEVNAPDHLRQKSLLLAGTLLEMSGKFLKGAGIDIAMTLLNNGKAYEKFMEICEAQGGFKEPTLAKYHYEVLSEKSGTVRSIDNRKLARVAKLAGAPKSPSSGLLFNSPIGAKVNHGDHLFTIYTESKGELEYVKDYLKGLSEIIIIE